MRLRELTLLAIKAASAVTDLIAGRRAGPRVLIYHQVGSDSRLEMDVPLEGFRSQVDWMQKNGEIVDLETALERAGQVGSDRLFVLTFDDGHKSVFDKAFPVMLELGVPFTMYLTTEPLEIGQPLHGDASMPVCTWSEIAEMMESGLLTVGAHSHGHLDARAHASDVLEADMRLCNELITERLGVDGDHFAYTWGISSAAADRIVRDLYRTAAIGSGPAWVESTDPYRIPRVPVMRSDGAGALFARKMWGGYRLETLLRSLRDRVRGGSQKV